MERINAWNTYDPGKLRSCMDFADDYKDRAGVYRQICK